MNLNYYEALLRKSGFEVIAGADEAGRGACAGPLVAAAVILGTGLNSEIPSLNDSKKLTAKSREKCYYQIMEKAVAVSWVRIEPQECDELGMQEADIQGLRRALLKLEIEPQFILTDGFEVDGLSVPGLAMWKGDQISACVAAASIVAKVTRDKIMSEYDLEYPQFSFSKHKGYCTALHQQELAKNGPSAIHRWCFELVARAGKIKAT